MGNNAFIQVNSELEQGIYTALETYSNVHRGIGLYSMVSTHFFDKARDIILEYLGLNKKKYSLFVKIT